MARKPNPPAGTNFRKLRVVCDAPPTDEGRSRVVVRCACGNRRTVLTSALRAKTRPLGGCPKCRGNRAGRPAVEGDAVLPVGAIRDRLTVLSHYREGKVRMVVCSCTCGRTHTARLFNLVYHSSRSCGCLRDERLRETRERAQKLRAEALGGHVQHAGGR